MVLTKGLIFAMVLATALVKGSPVEADSTTPQFLPGGLKPVDVNDEKVQSLAKFSLSAIKGNLGTENDLQLVKVTKAEKQVVAGLMYHITLEVSDSKGYSKSCKVKVLEQAWISPDPKVTDVQCDNKPSSK